MPNPRPTHFLCIQLINTSSRSQLETSLGELRSFILDQAPKQGVPTGFRDHLPIRALRHVGTLHLTLGVMDLEDAEKRKSAIHYLQGYDTRLSDPLVMSLQGLSSMTTPKSTSVVYLEPKDPTHRLIPLCETIRADFASAGFVTPENRPLRLHATILNSRYVNPSKPPKMDVRDLITRYHNKVWATEVRLNKLAICKMGSRSLFNSEGVIVDEVYDEIASVTL